MSAGSDDRNSSAIVSSPPRWTPPAQSLAPRPGSTPDATRSRYRAAFVGRTGPSPHCSEVRVHVSRCRGTHPAVLNRHHPAKHGMVLIVVLVHTVSAQAMEIASIPRSFPSGPPASDASRPASAFRLFRFHFQSLVPMQQSGHRTVDRAPCRAHPNVSTSCSRRRLPLRDETVDVSP